MGVLVLEEGVGLFGVFYGVVGVSGWGEGLGDGVVLVGDDDGFVHFVCLPFVVCCWGCVAGGRCLLIWGVWGEDLVDLFEDGFVGFVEELLV